MKVKRELQGVVKIKETFICKMLKSVEIQKKNANSTKLMSIAMRDMSMKN